LSATDVENSGWDRDEAIEETSKIKEQLDHPINYPRNVR